MTALISYFLAALVISFLCSLLESVLLSISIAHLSVVEKEGNSAGKLMAELKENISMQSVKIADARATHSFP